MFHHEKREGATGHERTSIDRVITSDADTTVRHTHSADQTAAL